MKRVLLITPFLFLSFISIKAQDEFKPEFYLGIIQGASFSKVDFAVAGIDQEFIPGYGGGLVFRYISEPVAGIQVELNYAEKGWSGKPGTYQYYKGRLSYIELPFLTHITLGKKRSYFTLNFGPYVSYMIMNDIKSNIDYPLDIDNKFEFGYCVAIGSGFRSPIGTFQIEGRYLNSVTNFFNTSTKTQFYASRNQVIFTSLTWLVKIK